MQRVNGRFAALKAGDRVQGKNGTYRMLDNKYLTTSEMIRAINNDETDLERYFCRGAAYIHKRSLKPSTQAMKDIVIDLIDSAKETV